VQVPQPPAAGDRSVVRQVRSVLFSEPLLGATRVRPKGLTKARLIGGLLGHWGAFVTRNMTEPLPPTTLFLAATTADIRLFAKPLFGDLYEIGRWKKGSYRASVNGSRLDLELERLGHVTLFGGAPEVVALVVQAAAGPAL